jgi:histidyl-tRNA synthetase
VKIEAPRGTHDVLANEWPHWQRIVDEARRLCELYGYRAITTPVFEDTELFRRTSGAGSDVVQKEMYSFSDRSDRSLTLRPEGTAPIARAYLEHGLQRQPQPAKLFTVAPMYRYSAPQRGRYREHWQLSVEAIGSGDPAIDAELIQLYAELLVTLEVREWTLLLNSIGDERCRPAYLERLTAWLDEHDAELRDEELREKRATNPLRVFDVKSEAARAALADAPRIGESLCEACAAHFAGVRAALDAYGVPYELDPTLVRGLDYYTRTAWEFVGPHEGAQSSLSGGGRYDGLIEEIGGAPTPGVGFGAGIERLHFALAAAAEAPAIDLFFAFADESRRLELLPLLAELRAEGRSAETDYAGRSLKGQLTQAGRLGARTVVIAGPEAATIRRADRPDASVPFSQLREELRET